MKIKTKIYKWDLIKVKKFLHLKAKETINKTKRNPPKWEKKNICKQRINLQNTQTVHAAQLKKKKKSNQTFRRSEERFHQRHTDGQQTHEKVLNITDHW